jgi:hypothetical protein
MTASALRYGAYILTSILFLTMPGEERALCATHAATASDLPRPILLAPPPAPISHFALHRLADDPAKLARLAHPLQIAFAPQTARLPPGSLWKNVPRAIGNPGAMLLLTDGSVLIQNQGNCNCGSSDWWRLAPDITGNYVNGTWNQVASMPSGYAPLYFASAILPDGRVIVEGGEYNNGSLVWTNQGAIYDPVADSWTSVIPPDGGNGEWSRIGDGPSTLLANGTFMFGASGYSGTTVEALLDPSNLTWTDTGSGKADGNGEEGWSLLPTGDVLTVDTGNGTNTELYDPKSGTWSSAGNTPQSLIFDGEVGPQVTRPDGTVFAVGATGHNAVYSTSAGTWSAAPDFPVIGGDQYDEADGPAAVLPDGKVLLMASPGEYQMPSHFFLFDGVNLTATEDTPDAANLSSFFGFMLMLPTGQVLFNDRAGGFWVYNSGAKKFPKSAPIITSVPVTITRGTQYTLRGRQLSGLTQGAAYGDDYQSATNYPLVRVTNAATGHVFYARTVDFTRTAVAPLVRGSTEFTFPDSAETGASMLSVVANGVSSKAVSVTIQ